MHSSTVSSKAAEQGTATTILVAYRREALLFALAGFALAIGTLVYLTDRAAGSAVLIPSLAALAGLHLFGLFGQWLPSFVHPFAFSLLTAAALPPQTTARYEACLAWCAVNLVFEIGQHPLLNTRFANAVRDIFGQTPPALALGNYFVHGSFDRGDIAAAILGSLAAAAVLRSAQPSIKVRHAP